MKTCKDCLIEKPLESFTLKDKKTGNRMTQCKPCRNAYSRRHASKPEVMAVRRIQKLEYWGKIKEHAHLKRTIYMREKRQIDPNARIANVMRATLSYLVTGRIKTTSKNIGCTGSELKAHLSELFVDGMTWDNYGEWEIDHILAVSKFNQQDEGEFNKCWNYLNLQPMWKNQNRKKSAGAL